MSAAWRVLSRLALAACGVAGLLLAATFGTSMALCTDEQVTWTLLFALGFLLCWQMALAFAGAIVLVAVKLPACTDRFGWRRTLLGAGTAWVVCAGAAWLLAEAFGRRGCSMLI